MGELSRTGALVEELRREIAAHGDAERAIGQQRYLKSAMPCLGVRLPVLRRVTRQVLVRHRLAERTDWLALVQELWDGATHREERYAAIAVLRLPHYRLWATDPSLLPLLRHLVMTGAWWDLVDELAAHCVGGILRAHPVQVTPVIRAWAGEEDLWVRRTAILSQLTFKGHTDVVLLADAIEQSLGDPDFFARKAIGWALRAYAATDAHWVRDFVKHHADRLSRLSVREALKHLGDEADEASMGPDELTVSPPESSERPPGSD